MHEVAAASVAEIQPVDAETSHLVVSFVDEALAFTAEGLEIGRGHGVFDDEAVFEDTWRDQLTAVDAPAPARRRTPTRIADCNGESRPVHSDLRSSALGPGRRGSTTIDA